MACLGSVCGQRKLKLPCQLKWTWHNCGFLPAKNLALYCFNLQGRAVSLLTIFSIVCQTGSPLMSMDHVNYWADALAVSSRKCTLTPQRAQPGGRFRDVSAETVSANKLSASWSLLLSACTIQEFNFLCVEGQGKYEWYMIRIVT